MDEAHAAKTSAEWSRLVVWRAHNSTPNCTGERLLVKMRATAAAISEEETLRADSRVDSLLSRADIETVPTTFDAWALALGDMPMLLLFG